jgi:hypothetical protein
MHIKYMTCVAQTYCQKKTVVFSKHVTNTVVMKRVYCSGGMLSAAVPFVGSFVGALHGGKIKHELSCEPVVNQSIHEEHAAPCSTYMVLEVMNLARLLYAAAYRP